MRRAVIVLGLLALCACKKERPPEGRVAGLALRALDVMPANLTYLAGVSFAGFRDSKLYARLLTAVRASPRIAALEEKVRQGCGIDVARDVVALVMGGSDLGNPGRALLLLQGTWDEGKVDRCLKEVIAPAQGAALSIKKDGALTEYTLVASGVEQRSYAAWLAPDTVLLAPYAAGDRTYLADVLSGKSPLRDDKRLVPLVKSTDTTATVWLVATAGDPMAADALAELGTPGGSRPVGLYVDVALTEGLRGRVGLRYGAERDARTVADQLRRELAEARRSQEGALLRDSSVTVRERDIVLGVRLDRAQVDELIRALEPYLGDAPGLLGMP
jgi:hypothetical protein